MDPEPQLHGTERTGAVGPGSAMRDYRQARAQAIGAMVDRHDARTGLAWATLALAASVRAGCEEIATALRVVATAVNLPVVTKTPPPTEHNPRRHMTTFDDLRAP